MCINWNIYIKCRIYLNPSIFKSFNHFQTAIELVHQSRNKKQKFVLLAKLAVMTGYIGITTAVPHDISTKAVDIFCHFCTKFGTQYRPCLCAGNLYGLHVFGECFCVKATCCKCDFFLGNNGMLFSWKRVSDDIGIMSDLSEVKKTVKLSEI